MRTKAEAAAKPLPGDRWEKNVRGKVVVRVVVGVAPSKVAVHYRANKSTTVRTSYRWTFEEWCQNAAYLGGRDENQG